MTTNPPPPDLIRVEGNGLSYLRPMKPRERISFLITGFGAIGMTYIIMSAGIDISVGSVVALVTVVIALFVITFLVDQNLNEHIVDGLTRSDASTLPETIATGE